MSLLKSRFIEMFGNVATNNKRWEKTKLGNKSVIGSSKRIFANEYTTEGIPFYRSKEIIELGMGEKPSVELYISKKRYQEIKEKFGIPIPGDILMTAVGTIGKFWIVPNSKPFYYKDGNLVYIRTKEFNPLFLKKLLEMLIEKYKVENANGSAYTALTIEKLKDLQIVLPPMTLQKQYEEFHIQIDKSKFLLQQILEKFELLKKSRFIEMFGDVINNKKTWPTKRWSYVLNIVNGKNQKKVECENGIYPICGSGGKIGKTNEYLTKENSVIIGRKGNINNPILMKTKFWNVDTAFGLEPNNKDINVEYLYKFCELFDFQRLNKTVTIPSLTKSDLLKIEIPVPPMKLQEEYRNFLAQVDKSKFNVFQDQTAAQVKVIVVLHHIC